MLRLMAAPTWACESRDGSFWRARHSSYTDVQKLKESNSTSLQQQTVYLFAKYMKTDPLIISMDFMHILA